MRFDDMYSEQMLFSDEELTSMLETEIGNLYWTVRTWGLGHMLALDENEFVDYLIAEHTVQCPILRHDQIHQLPVETIKTISSQPHGGLPTIDEPLIVVAIPFDGDKRIFRARPSRISSNLPIGRVIDGEIHISWPDNIIEPAAIRQHIDTVIDQIDQHLKWAHADLESFNARVRAEAQALVGQQRSKLRDEQRLAASVGYPIRERDDAANYAVPASRRRISARRPPSTTEHFTPEPFLPVEQYEAALKVLINARNALERSPSTTTKLGEEEIRNLLLISLNAQFEGKAAGEVFNGDGKTDILIRAEDRNIFIAECKIWNGPKTILAGLDQLLSYLVWRDTKAALLLFIRNGEPTSIITKTIQEIENHPNYKRTTTHGEPGERYNFVLHANSDTAQEIRLAFLPFIFNMNSSTP